MNKRLTKQDLEYAVIGGSILGGGGGGSIEMGREIGERALEIGDVYLVSTDEIPDQAVLLTVSAVGAPAAKMKKVKPEDYLRTIKMYEEVINRSVDGFITNENGGTATVNGWIQAASYGKPLVDAPCNGRAHPTGIMGSMGLHKLKDYTSVQTAVGGDSEKQMDVEVYCRGNIYNTSSIVRQASIGAGGLVAVARNHVSADYVKNNGAPGAIAQAIEIGEAFYKGIKTSSDEAIRCVCEVVDAQIVAKGKVKDYKIETLDGFDIGMFQVDNQELTFWNEYMTLDLGGDRLYTFPDLIMTMNLMTGRPVTSAEIEENMEVAVIATKSENLILGAGMFDPDLLEDVEKVIGRKMVPYVFKYEK